MSIACLIRAMAHDRRDNYAIPGLSSHLLGGPEVPGTIRLFTADRNTEHHITPHSHRFDFACVVVQGRVTNTVYHPHAFHTAEASDFYAQGVVRPKNGGLGDYELEPGTEPKVWWRKAETYKHGQWYYMKHDEIHSISFSAGAMVVFFEGPEVTETSVILEPWSNGVRVPTFETRPWMFQRPQVA